MKTTYFEPVPASTNRLRGRFAGVLNTALLLMLALTYSSAPCAAQGQVPAKAQHLLIYSIDVEGGQSTLLVSPTGASLLVDTGWGGNNGRDAQRIVDAMHDAGI